MADIPIEEAIRMKKQGMSNEEINARLQAKGFSLAQISEAMTQANIKKGVEDNPNPDDYQGPGMESSELDKPEEEIPVPTPTKGAEKMSKTKEEEFMGPHPASASFSPAKPVIEDIQALVEEIISEKWGELVSTIGDVNMWRTRMSDDVESIKQEIIRMQGRVENLQTALLGKVKEYDQDIKEVTSEMKALEKVFEKIMEPLVTNIKELSKITEELKKRK